MMEGAANFIKNSCVSDDGTLGFKNSSKEDATSCITYFALKTLSIADKINYPKFIEDNKESIINFYRKCNFKGWDGADLRSMAHMRFTLMALEHLNVGILSYFGKKQNQIEEMVEYVEGCYLNGGFGFAKGFAPNIYATRQAIEIIELLKDFGATKYIATYKKDGSNGNTAIKNFANKLFTEEGTALISGFNGLIPVANKFENLKEDLNLECILDPYVPDIYLSDILKIIQQIPLYYNKVNKIVISKNEIKDNIRYCKFPIKIYSGDTIENIISSQEQFLLWYFSRMRPEITSLFIISNQREARKA
jgi:hypothetical protein